MPTLVILFALAAADRLIKISAIDHPRQTFSILWRLLWYAPMANVSGQLSLHLSPTLAMALALVVGAVASVLAFRTQSTMLRLAYGLIAIGVLSNAYDRYAFGYVIDVFGVVGGLSFNVADIFIVTGIGLLIPGLVLP